MRRTDLLRVGEAITVVLGGAAFQARVIRGLRPHYRSAKAARMFAFKTVHSDVHKTSRGLLAYVDEGIEWVRGHNTGDESALLAAAVLAGVANLKSAPERRGTNTNGSRYII